MWKYLISPVQTHSKAQCQSDRPLQYTKKYQINFKKYIFSNWVINFKSSKTVLHRTLNSFPPPSGDLQEDICRFKQASHHSSTPSSSQALPSSELQWWFSDWTPVFLTNFPPTFCFPHFALFPRQCRLCPGPQRHFSKHRSLSAIITRHLCTRGCAQKAEQVKKEQIPFPRLLWNRRVGDLHFQSLWNLAKSATEGIKPPQPNKTQTILSIKEPHNTPSS